MDSQHARVILPQCPDSMEFVMCVEQLFRQKKLSKSCRRFHCKIRRPLIVLYALAMDGAYSGVLFLRYLLVGRWSRT